MNPEGVLAQIAEEVAICQKCELHFSRKNSVPGEGPATAEIMLIGEGPGFYENEQGRPFVGSAGKLLEDLLGQAGLKRTEVWIGNVLKCRPPGNRDPQPEELAACDEYLERQMRAISPRVIISLGRYSMIKFMPEAKISQVHGQMRRIGNHFVIAMYHPAAALHQPKFKEPLLADFARLPQMLEQARRAMAELAQVDKQEPEVQKEDPRQLNLF